MRDFTVLGMPVVVHEGDRINDAQPLSAFVIVKALGNDGKIFYLVTATEGLHIIESLGMVELARLNLQDKI